jgi:Trypsin-like peptidase domain
MAASDSTPPVAAHAAHLLPHLEAVARRFEDSPQTVVRRAFPTGASRPRRRAIVGPRAGLPPPADDRVDPALSAERKRLLEVGASALDTLRTEGPDVDLTPESQLGIEAIVSVARPALLMQEGQFADPLPPWDDILGPYRESIKASSESVGRIGVRGLPQVPYAGTGFLVAEDVVMTNCHVARVFAQSGSEDDWSLRTGLEPNLDFRDDPDVKRTEPASHTDLRINEVIGIHPTLDLALLRVTPPDAGNGTAKPLSVMSEDPGPLVGRNLYVLGYPAPDRRNNPMIQRSIFGDRYFVKRLQPGAVMPPPPGAAIRAEPCSMGTEPRDVVFHDASTLGGNSGSCVVDLDTGQAIGLHFGGQYMHYNVAVALWRLAHDPLLTRAGVNFA